MKLYAPQYYKDFKCIADKCDHSCCIGWEIDVDGEALERYEGLSGGYGDAVKDSISYDGHIYSLFIPEDEKELYKKALKLGLKAFNTEVKYDED